MEHQFPGDGESVWGDRGGLVGDAEDVQVRGFWGVYDGPVAVVAERGVPAAADPDSGFEQLQCRVVSRVLLDWVHHRGQDRHRPAMPDVLCFND
jgi:hypothetical protein